MRIKFSNVGNPMKVQHQIILIKGRIENYSQDVWRKYNEKSFMVVYHQADNEYKRCEEILMRRLEFKFLVKLHLGENTFKLDFLGIKDTLKVNYQPVANEYSLRLVYVVCKDGDANFQGPPGMDCGLESAKARICLGAQLLQCIMAETLWEAGYGRKTFNLHQDQNGSVVCHTFETGLSTSECWSMSGEELWEHVGRELMLSELGDDKCKYLAFLASTRYSNPDGIAPTSYAQVCKLTKGHVALGGGGLALFGTGSLWTWPTAVSQVQSRLLCADRIDTRQLMDDSAYRGTVGGSFATTLGSVLHEVGHCFDLGHTAEGVMARGFDDLDRFFTLEKGSALEQRRRRRLDPCSSYHLRGEELGQVALERSNSCLTGDSSPRFTSVRRSDSISKYLEGYSQKRLRCQQSKESLGVFWTSSCAILLSRQKWMNYNSQCSKQKEDVCGIEMCCELGVLEVRGEGGKVIKFWTSEYPEWDIESFLQANSVATNLLAITHCGNVFKKEVQAF